MIIQVTPRAMLNTLFRHRYKFTSVFLLFFGVAVSYCLWAIPRYESDAALLVKFAPNQTTRTENLPPTGISASMIERQEVINSQIGLIQSQDLLTDLLNTLSIGAIYPALASIDDPKLRLNTALVRLNKDLDVEADKNSDIIQLTLLNANPDISAKALRLLIDKFLAKQSQIYQSGQLAFMQKQVAQAREQVDKSRAAVEAYKASTGISSEDEERTLLLKQQSDAQENLTLAIAKEQEAQGRYQRLEEMLKGMPSEIKLSDENDRFKAVDDNRQKLDDLLSRQKQMSLNYRPDSTTMQDLNSQIAFAQQQLARASKESAARIRSGAHPVRQQTENARGEAAGDQFGAAASRASYESELARIKEKLSTLEQQTQHLNALELQQQVDEDNLRNYLQAVNDARVTDDLNRERISSVVVVQNPTVPVLPARPRVLLILAAGFLLGLTGAITVTLLAEMGDEAFSTADQIETVLGLPVLATFTMRRRLESPRTQLPSYVKLLPALILLVAASIPGIAFGFDHLDPNYNLPLVIKGQDGKLAEYLSPDPNSGQFQRSGPWGQPLGWARLIGRTLVFFDPHGHRTATARAELLPPSYSINAIAIVRDTSGNPIGMITSR